MNKFMWIAALAAMLAACGGEVDTGLAANGRGDGAMSDEAFAAYVATLFSNTSDGAAPLMLKNLSQ